MKYFLYDFAGYNKIIFEKINYFLGQEESYILSCADQIGLYRSFPIILPILIIYGYFAITSVKHDRVAYINTINLWFQTFSTLFFSMFLVFLIVASMKIGFAFSRPFCTEGLLQIKIFNAALSTIKCDHSFPSGHTAYSCTMLFSIWPILNRPTKLIGCFLAISIALSRIASGVHFPADIFWAAIISLVVVCLTNYCLRFTLKFLSPHLVEFVDQKL